MAAKKATVSDSLQSGTTPDSAGRQSLEPLVDSRAIAELLGLQVRTIRTMTSQKRLPHFLIGGSAIRYRASDVMAYLESKAPKLRR
jgi:excisionase family DNA binding protein